MPRRERVRPIVGASGLRNDQLDPKEHEQAGEAKQDIAERRDQRGIMIGHRGSHLSKIGAAARHQIQPCSGLRSSSICG
jgi:GTPase Era involved in 16S rRNA processing